jgi:hypothetical protein
VRPAARTVFRFALGDEATPSIKEQVASRHLEAKALHLKPSGWAAVSEFVVTNRDLFEQLLRDRGLVAGEAGAAMGAADGGVAESGAAEGGAVEGGAPSQS